VSPELGTRVDLLVAVRLRRQAAAATLQAALRSLEQEQLFRESVDPEIAELRDSMRQARDLLVAPVLTRTQRTLDREHRASESLHRLANAQAARTSKTRRQQLLERMQAAEVAEVELTRGRLEEAGLRAAPVLAGERSHGEPWP